MLKPRHAQAWLVGRREGGVALSRLQTCLASVTRAPTQQESPFIQRIRSKVCLHDQAQLHGVTYAPGGSRTRSARVTAQAPSAALDRWLAGGGDSGKAMPVAHVAVDSLQAIRCSSEACAAEVRRMHACLDVLETVRSASPSDCCNWRVCPTRCIGDRLGLLPKAALTG